MPVPHIFGTQTSPAAASKLDENFVAVADVLLADAGAIVTTHQALGALEPRNPKLHFGSLWDSTTSNSTGLQNAIIGAYESGRGEVFLPGGDIRLDLTAELNNQTATGNYRKSLRILGAGRSRTRLINRVTAADSVHGRALFQHTLTQAQGDANFFAHGLELAHMEIYADGSSHASCVGVSLEGAYNPWLHDLLINGMGSHGIVTPTDSRWVDLSDRYSCADVILDRVTIISCGGWAGYNGAFATAWKVNAGCYIVSNAAGGLYLEGCNHELRPNSIAGNGTSGVATSAGVMIARSTEGTPRNVIITGGVEFDANWVNQIRTNGGHGLIANVRFKDTVSAGAFRAPVQVRVLAIVGQQADGNRILDSNFYFADQAAVNGTAIQFDLDVNDGRTVRYNVSEANLFEASGVTSGVITEVSYGTNPNVSGSIGNRHFTLTQPRGSVITGQITKNLADASGTISVTGLGFRPSSISFDGFSNAMKTQAYADCSTLSPSNRGTYYYPTGAVWASTGSNNAMTFRTAAGDQMDAYTSSTTPDGFVLTTTKTGSPTGTATIFWAATRA